MLHINDLVSRLVLKLYLRPVSQACNSHSHWIQSRSSWCLRSLVCMCVYAGSKYTLETRPQELGMDVREELLKLHSKHYSSNLMALVVLGGGELSDCLL